MITSTADDLKAMIHISIINNNVVTTDDVNLDTKSYGPDIECTKGKTMRSRLMSVVRNIVEIPDEFLVTQQDLTVSMDRLTVNYLRFLCNIYHELYYRTTQCAPKPVASVYKFFIDKILAVYKRGGLISPISTTIMNFVK